VYTALLHVNNIIHGDLTTSNFIAGKKIALIDFGLSYYSNRMEDKAVDIRLVKQALSSAHISIFEDAFASFTKGYLSVTGEKKTHKVLENVEEIEKRGRYARVV
ncbi:MAG: hypothetical protein WBY71_05590, partial [Nitrososphaeraceae archaeon]